MSLITTDIKIGLVVLNAANEISFCLGLGQKAIIQEKIIDIFGKRESVFVKVVGT